MKKIIRWLALVATVGVVGGCYSSKVSNEFISEYKEVNSMQELVYNVEQSVSNLDAFSFQSEIIVGEKSYLLSGSVIIGDSIEKSIIKLSYNDITVYIKNETVYISYYHNSTNIIVKDSLDVFVKEISNLFVSKGLEITERDIYNFINRLYSKEYDFSFMKDYSYYSYEGNYIVKEDYLDVTLNEYFLPRFIKCDFGVVVVNISLNYEDVIIKVPLGYNLFTLDIEDVKESFDINLLK